MQTRPHFIKTVQMAACAAAMAASVIGVNSVYADDAGTRSVQAGGDQSWHSPSLNMEPAVGPDGSVRLVFSPTKPAGVPDANWIQTNPEKGFLAYFRWYSPTRAFFDRSWKMGNIKEVN